MTDAVTVRADGKAEMAYVGETPWHKLGNELKPGASIEEWTKAAGFDFEIKTAPMLFKAESGKTYEIDDRVVTYRADNDLALGRVSTKYKVIQPGEVMDYFAKLAEKGGLELETAGTLHGGKRFWAMARIGKPQIITNPNDKVKAFLLLSSSADGFSPTIGKFGIVRVVCQNTLTAFLKDRNGGTEHRQRHISTFDPDKMNEALGIKLEEQFTESMKIFRKLAKTPMSKPDMVRASMLAFNPEVETIKPDTIPDLIPKILKRKHVKAVNDLAIANNIIGGNLLTHDTAAIWLNAVTQQIDHCPGYKSIDRAAEQALFGSDEIKQRAFALAEGYAAGNMPQIKGLSNDMLLSMMAEAEA